MAESDLNEQKLPRSSVYFAEQNSVQEPSLMWKVSTWPQSFCSLWVSCSLCWMSWQRNCCCSPVERVMKICQSVWDSTTGLFFKINYKTPHLSARRLMVQMDNHLKSAAKRGSCWSQGCGQCQTHPQVGCGHLQSAEYQWNQAKLLLAYRKGMRKKIISWN